MMSSGPLSPSSGSLSSSPSSGSLLYSPGLVQSPSTATGPGSGPVTGAQQATTSLTTLPGGVVAISPSMGRFGVSSDSPDRPAKTKRLSDESRPSTPRFIQRDLGAPRNRHSRVICEDERNDSSLPSSSSASSSSSSSSGRHTADDALVRARGESSPVKITRNRSLPSEQL